MIFGVNPRDTEPVYTQIENGIGFAILRGVWREGEQLPSRRDLADELRVNPNTIAVAYKNLERDRIAEVRRGLGAFVAKGAADVCRRKRGEMLAAKFARIISQARQANLEQAQIRTLFERHLEDVFTGRPDAGDGGTE